MAETSAIEKGYQSAALSSRGPFWFLVCFVLAMAALLGGVKLWHNKYHSVAASTQPRTPEAALAQPLQPSPGHETLPWQDMAQMRARQERLLEAGGPLPGDPSHLRIPIDRAIDQLLQSGALGKSWKVPATEPWIRPPGENAPTVRNRT